MKYSHLLSAILREPWAIEPQSAIALGSLVVKLLNGEASQFTARDEFEARFHNAFSAQSFNALSQDTEADEIPAGSVAIIPLKGEMLKYGTLCSYGTQEIASMLSQFLSHKNIIGAVLDIDSGGGAVNAISPLTHVIKTSQKPIVSLCDTAASAAYYVAVATDHVMADNDLSSVFGSIGIEAQFVDVKPHLEKQGYKIHTVHPPESSEKNLAFEKAMQGDYSAIIAEYLSPMAKNFQAHVLDRMKGIDQSVPGIINGKVFFALDALAHGMIHSIGNMDLAIEKVKTLHSIRTFMNP